MGVDFSICTPVFNRAHLLPRLYSSLLLNIDENISFEWLIVDDGSSDDIAAFISMVKAENKLDVKYIKKTNEGKHSCMNVFFAQARGELTLILDSDDKLVKDALRQVKGIWEPLALREDIAGIIGLCLDMATQKPSAQCFVNDPMESTVLENAYKHNMKGDRCDFIRTSLLQDKLFPVYADEKFMPEAVITVLFDADYKYYCTNLAFKEIEYQADGLTNTYAALAMNNPKGMVLRFEVVLNNYDLIKLPAGFNKLKFYGNYMRYLIHRSGFFTAYKAYFKVTKFFKLSWFAGCFIGSALAVLDKIKK